jgi:preprotein translocase subunit SecD
MKTPQRLLPSLLFALLLAGTASCKWAGHAFGPKDEGGMYLIIAVKADGAQLDQAVAQTIEVMQKRCEQLNLYCKAERVGGDKPNQIRLRISDPKNPERVKGVILSQGLELRAVVSPPSPAPVQTYPTQEEAAAAAGSEKDVLPYVEDTDGPPGSSQRKFVVVERAPIVDGRDVLDAEAVGRVIGGEDDYSVNFTLRPDGAVRFGRWTGENINNYLAAVLNKQVRSVAYIKSQIFDSAQITGRFTKEQAEDIALVIKSGDLPAPIEALEEGVYKP